MARKVESSIRRRPKGFKSSSLPSERRSSSSKKGGATTAEQIYAKNITLASGGTVTTKVDGTTGVTTSTYTGRITQDPKTGRIYTGSSQRGSSSSTTSPRLQTGYASSQAARIAQVGSEPTQMSRYQEFRSSPQSQIRAVTPSQAFIGRMATTPPTPKGTQGGTISAVYPKAELFKESGSFLQQKSQDLNVRSQTATGVFKKVGYGTAAIGITAASYPAEFVRHPIRSATSLFKPSTYTQGFTYFKSKARRGDPTILGDFGGMYLVGKGTSKTFEFGARQVKGTPPKTTDILGDVGVSIKSKPVKFEFIETGKTKPFELFRPVQQTTFKYTAKKGAFRKADVTLTTSELGGFKEVQTMGKTQYVTELLPGAKKATVTKMRGGKTLRTSKVGVKPSKDGLVFERTARQSTTDFVEFGKGKTQSVFQARGTIEYYRVGGRFQGKDVFGFVSKEALSKKTTTTDPATYQIGYSFARGGKKGDIKFLKPQRFQQELKIGKPKKRETFLTTQINEAVFETPKVRVTEVETFRYGKLYSKGIMAIEGEGYFSTTPPRSLRIKGKERWPSKPEPMISEAFDVAIAKLRNKRLGINTETATKPSNRFDFLGLKRMGKRGSLELKPKTKVLERSITKLDFPKVQAQRISFMRTKQSRIPKVGIVYGLASPVSLKRQSLLNTQRNKQFTNQLSQPRTTQKLGFDYIHRPDTRIRTSTITKTDTSQGFVPKSPFSSTTTGGGLPPPPIFTPDPIIPGGLGAGLPQKMVLFGRKKKRRKSVKGKRKYTPSLSATLLGVTGKMSKKAFATGIGIRAKSPRGRRL